MEPLDGVGSDGKRIRQPLAFGPGGPEANSREFRYLQSDGIRIWTRRYLLRASTGLGLSFLLPGMDLRAQAKRGKQRAKSLIVLWLAGGPSQLETWDPHPGTAIGGPTQAIGTKIPGLEIAALYPQMAEQIGSLSVIRSMISKEGDHQRGTYFLKTGYRPDPTVTHPSIGTILVHENIDSGLEIPQHVSLLPAHWPARGGYLGDQFDAFKIFNPGQGVQNMRSHVSHQQQNRRLANLEVVSRAFQRNRTVQVANTLHQLTIQRALEMMTSEQLKAFELDDEPQRVRAAYGLTPFGRGCLIARRLVEQGVRAIELTLDRWDTHTSNFSGHTKNAAILDPALASLIQELNQRDLLESTVVLAIGEFGRTPKINPLDGRDHWPSGFSCLVGGGGLRSGLVIGATDPAGDIQQPLDPIEVQDLFATILKVMD